VFIKDGQQLDGSCLDLGGLINNPLKDAGAD